MPETTRIISPTDGSLYAERPFASDSALDAAVAGARRAHADRARLSMPSPDRGGICSVAFFVRTPLTQLLRSCARERGSRALRSGLAA